MHHFRSLIVSASLAASLALACGNSDHGEHSEGSSSGAQCPPASTLTYDSIGEGFMNTYCVSCHSSQLAADKRSGAPSDHNYDTLARIRDASLEHLDMMAAAGPDAVNTQMPPRGPTPSIEERRALGEWLACGAP